MLEKFFTEKFQVETESTSKLVSVWAFRFLDTPVLWE